MNNKQKEIIIELKMKNSYFSRDMIKKMQRQSTNGAVNICKAHT
jgi:hypothetical protein